MWMHYLTATGKTKGSDLWQQNVIHMYAKQSLYRRLLASVCTHAPAQKAESNSENYLENCLGIIFLENPVQSHEIMFLELISQSFPAGVHFEETFCASKVPLKVRSKWCGFKGVPLIACMALGRFSTVLPGQPRVATKNSWITRFDGAGTTPIPINWGNSDQNSDHGEFEPPELKSTVNL